MMAPTNEPRRPDPAIVLVVEDDPILMLMLTDFVEEAGCEAVEARGVAEAMEILNDRADIRTVFTDMDIRGSHAGLNLMLAIRDRWPPIELLMIGSDPYKDTELPVRGVLLGKPFNSRKIVAAIRNFAS